MEAAVPIPSNGDGGKKVPPSRQAHSCPVCERVFSRREYAIRHYKKKHNSAISRFGPTFEPVAKSKSDSNETVSPPPTMSMSLSMMQPSDAATGAASSESTAHITEEWQSFFDTMGWGNLDNQIVGMSPPAAGDVYLAKEIEIAGIMVDLQPLYTASLVDFVLFFPKSVREKVAHNLGVAAFSSTLGRAAAMSWTVLQQARTMGEEGSELQISLLAKANEYYEIAVNLIGKEVLPPSTGLLATLDLYYYKLELDSVREAFQFLPIAQLLVAQILTEQNPHQPPKINFNTIPAPYSVAIRAVAYIDLFYALSHSTVPFFDYANIPGEDCTIEDYDGDAVDADGISNSSLSIQHGLPVPIVLCLVAISKICEERDSLSPARIKEKAAVIEKQIRDWKGSFVADDFANSTAYIANMATMEMWRHAALIFLYQAVHRVGPLSSVVCGSLRQIINLGSYDPSYAFFCPGLSRSWPWFIAATIAHQDEDREQCRIGLESCGQAKIFADNLKAAELIWERSDKTGWVPDWRELMKEGSISVAFM